jgi:hypothetical protein
MFSNEESIDNLEESGYQGIVESIMEEIQQKNNLMPREKNTTSVPSKKIILRNKANEAVVTKPLVEKQVAQNKILETLETHVNVLNMQKIDIAKQ